jgi:Holliday junction resolvase RusA-like endonuclease
MIEFTIPTVPVAQPRQRHAVHGGHVRNYIPKDNPVWAFKAAAQVAVANAYQGAPLDHPLRVDLVFVMPRPKSMVWKRRPMPREPFGKKPDRDNLEKSLYDALNGLLWRDDSLICDGRVQKVYAAGDEQPHVEVVVSEATA